MSLRGRRIPRGPRAPVARRAAAVAAVLIAAAVAPALAERIAYPETPVRVVADTLHGRILEDAYRWLEDDTSAAVRRWSAEQNALTRAYLDAFPGRSALVERLKRLYAVPVTGSPHVSGTRLFFSRRGGGQNQPVIHARDLGGAGPDRVAIDPNGLSADGTVAMDWMYPSPDGSSIAYGVSARGSEKSTLRVRRVDAGEDLEEAIPNTQFASVAWDPDGKGFLYTRHPARGEVPEGEEVFHERVYHHRLGAPVAEDVLVYGGEGAPIQESRGVSLSSDRQWVFLTRSLDWARNDVLMRRAGASGPFTPVATGLDGTTQPDAWDGTLYLLTNVGAPRYRIVTADPAAPGPENWKVLIPEQAGVIGGFRLVGGLLAIEVADSAVSRLFLHGLDGTRRKEIVLPAPGTVGRLAGEPTGRELFFTFTSFVHPAAVYRYDLARDRLERIEPADPALDPARFETVRTAYTSKDGTRVPIFIVHRKGLKPDGRRPTLLNGYGGFNVSETPAFRQSLIPWLEAGGVFALACLRGGGEFGRAWHEAGRLERKQNVFDDFHAAAEFLVRHGLTEPARLAAMGGSNGGLLVGAALTQRPDLFGAIVCQVPLLDMIRYHRFSIARYWVPEYGSSEDPEQFEFLLAYSPYHRVAPGTRYPATLLVSGGEDSRVVPLHARKMAAALQAATAGDGPILFRLDLAAGHGAGKPASKRIEEAADVLAFLMRRMGLEPGP